MTPHVERTEFVPHEPPAAMTFWFCPACGQQITGSYNIEPARKRCTKTWHLTNVVGVRYVREDRET